MIVGGQAHLIQRAADPQTVEASLLRVRLLRCAHAAGGMSISARRAQRTAREP